MSCKKSWIQGCSLEAAGTNFEHRGNPGFGQSLKLSILMMRIATCSARLLHVYLAEACA